MNWLRHIPNAITFARIFAMIPLVWFMLEKKYEVSFYIAMVAGFSDLLDGFLAKRFGWEGWLGGILDPLADKFMMLCCFLVFAVQNIIPNWLLIIVLARDVVIVTGTTLYHFTVDRMQKAQPSLLSKTNTALQILLIVVVLAHYSVYQFNENILQGLIYLVTFFTVISGLHYVYLFFTHRKSFLQKQNRESE